MEKKKPVKIIFDTDIGVDCDDAGALALIHRLCNRKEAELLAVTHCYSSPYVAGCIDSINNFFGREIPIGINYDSGINGEDVYAQLLCDNFKNRYPSETYQTSRSVPDTLTVLRSTLANAENKSITLVVTGSFDSMKKLVLSEPDNISPLSGKELIKQKILRTVVMGGRFFESWPMTVYQDGNPEKGPVSWEWNVRANGSGASKTVCDEWDGELVFSSYEIGSYIKTMVQYPNRAPANDPVAAAYYAFNKGKGRCSWDLTAVLEAVRPEEYWNYHDYGKITVNSDYITQWSPNENYKHTYLLPKIDYEIIRKTIDGLIDGK